MWEGPYGDAAAANLSVHRSQVVKRWSNQRKELQGQSPDWHNGQMLWGRFEPFVTCPPGMELARIGAGGLADGGKWVCGITSLKPPCLVYSLGSHGQFDFEDAVLNSTQCEVHTFDCTITGESRAVGRHFYHQICLGTDEVHNGSVYMSWATVLKHLGHEQRQVDLLKVDIEGFEVEFLQEWFEQTTDYPQQLAIEMHYSHHFETPRHMMTLGDMSLFMMHLYNLGYALYSKEVNAPYPSNCEFSLIRVELPSGSS